MSRLWIIYPQEILRILQQLNILRLCLSWDRMGQDGTGWDGMGQDGMGQDRMGRDRTGQDWTGQNRMHGAISDTCSKLYLLRLINMYKYHHYLAAQYNYVINTDKVLWWPSDRLVMVQVWRAPVTREHMAWKYSCVLTIFSAFIEFLFQ